MSVYVGIALAMTASAMNATGMNLQRYGANVEKNGKIHACIRLSSNSCLHIATQRRDKTWGKRINIFGVVLSIACGIVDFISYGFAPQSTLAPFGSMSLIVNLMLAPLLHGETLEVNIRTLSTLVCFSIQSDNEKKAYRFDFNCNGDGRISYLYYLWIEGSTST